MPGWRVASKGQAVWIRWENIRSGFEAWVLVRGDAHFDSEFADHQLEISHLEQAKERDAAVIDLGDLWSAMQGVHDPRRRSDEGLDEYEQVDYFDHLVAGAERRYHPYAENWAVQLMGNHEAKVLTHEQTNLVRRFVARMRKHGSQAVACDTEQWLRFWFSEGESGGEKRRSQSIDAYAVHGVGGAAQVTKGTIQMERRQAWVNADMILSGHVHTPLHVPAVRVGLNQYGNIERQRVDHIQVSGYETGREGRSSYLKKKGIRDQLAIAYWIHFYIPRGRRRAIKRRILEVAD